MVIILNYSILYATRWLARFHSRLRYATIVLGVLTWRKMLLKNNEKSFIFIGHHSKHKPRLNSLTLKTRWRYYRLGNFLISIFISPHYSPRVPVPFLAHFAQKLAGFGLLLLRWPVRNLIGAKYWLLRRLAPNTHLNMRRPCFWYIFLIL